MNRLITSLFALLFATILFAQTGTLKGYVTDNSGNPAIFIAVWIEVDTIKLSSPTDMDGNYTISGVPVGTYDVFFSGVDFEDKTLHDVLVQENKTTFADVVLDEGEVELDAVIIDYDVEYVEEVISYSYEKNELNKSMPSIVADEIYYADPAGVAYYDNFSITEAEIDNRYNGDGYYTEPNYGAGQLTATEINDFAKWELWNDITEGELNQHIATWNLMMTERYTVQVVSDKGMPVINAVAVLKQDNTVIWTGKTDNTGKAELWNGITPNETTAKLTIEVTYNGKTLKDNDITDAQTAPNNFVFNASCDYSNLVDIALVVDATGSMDDEIDYLKVELEDIIIKVQEHYENININTGTVFYKCTGNDYSTKYSQFTDVLQNTVDYIRQQDADDGGEELVDSALFVALNSLEWREEARTRVMFLVLDEPSAHDDLTLSNLEKYIKQAAEMGVKIIPVVASGEGYDKDKRLEYLVRCAALATNGTCAFITDHSGIGNSHTEPTTDEMTIETLNELLLRVIDQNIYVPPCAEELFIVENDAQDTTLVELPDLASSTVESTDPAIRLDSNDLAATAIAVPTFSFYPNPTTGPLTIETDGLAQELYLADMNGKLLQRIEMMDVTRTQIDMSNYPTGIYFIQCFNGDVPYSGKVILTRY